jgi:hypothetical protein
MSNKMNNSLFCEHLQHTSATQPICSHVGGQFAPFPIHFEEFPLDVVDGLKGYKLATTTKNGVNRFALRTPAGRILKPMDEDRRVRVRIEGALKHFNVSNLLASYVLNKDVTDNEYGILPTADGMWVESAADRTTLCTELKLKRNTLPRVELECIQRPNASDIDVRGKGYYVERGVVYKKNGTPIYVTKTGHIYLTGAMGKQEGVGLGWVLFAAYPDFYGYKHGLHTQMDHINGISTDNEAWNFRPMTVHQNAAVKHQTGFRSRRPSPNSSHERFKSKYPEEKLTPRMISNWQKNGSLRRYAETSYWLHKDGAVLLRQSSGFVYADLTVNRHKYTYTARGCKVHVMMMRAFGEYKNGLVVMHLDNYKENNALSNLKMGTHEENGVGNAVQITIQHADGTEVPTTYRSECEAARRVGINLSTVHKNRKRQRPGSQRKFSTSHGIKFAATDPPQRPRDEAR